MSTTSRSIFPVVRNLLRNEEDRQVVQAIVGVARQFHIETIAEGVEDQATMDELRRHGSRLRQGFWIGRRLPLARLWDVLGQRHGDYMPRNHDCPRAAIQPRTERYGVGSTRRIR